MANQRFQILLRRVRLPSRGEVPFQGLSDAGKNVFSKLAPAFVGQIVSLQIQRSSLDFRVRS